MKTESKGEATSNLAQPQDNLQHDSDHEDVINEKLDQTVDMLNRMDEEKQIRIQKDEESFQRKLSSEKPQADDPSDDSEVQDQLFADPNKVALQ